MIRRAAIATWDWSLECVGMLFVGLGYLALKAADKLADICTGADDPDDEGDSP